MQQTILFASQKDKALEFCTEELMAFLGINVAMGILHLPQVKDYWSTDKILSTPWFPSIMSRDRFLTILKFLHLVDSTLQKRKGEEGYDPLFKIRFLVDHLAAVYPQYYFPSRHLSIDEMMVGTRCRVVFLQYLPKKPTKFGIKVWVNSEAKTGYVLNFQIYTGSENRTQGKGLAYRVVMDLMEPYFHKGHCLFVDNFYTSVKLLIDLLAKGTYCAGTTRSNRKYFPVELIPPKGTKVEPGNFRFAIGEHSTTAEDNIAQDSSQGKDTTHTSDQENSNKDLTDKIIAVWWQDRRNVLALSTMHNTSAASVMKRPKGSHEKIPLPCPTIITDYNQYMGGVDLMDQHLSYYSLTTRRTLKWWKKVFWRLVDISIVNAWIIFRHNNPESDIKSHREFRLKLVEELVQPLLDLQADPDCPKYLSSPRRQHPSVTVDSGKHLLGKHFAYKSSRRGRCCICSQKISPVTKKRKDTKTQNFCKKCGVHLCIGMCFEVYHTRTSY